MKCHSMIINLVSGHRQAQGLKTPEAEHLCHVGQRWGVQTVENWASWGHMLLKGTEMILVRIFMLDGDGPL